MSEVQGKLRVPGQKPRADQRRDQRDKAAGVAAGHRDAPGGKHGLARVRAQLGQPVGPAQGRAVRGGGVEYDGVRVFHHLHGLARRRVRQAQYRRVAGVERALAAGGVLALRLRKDDQLYIRPRLQPLVDAQSGGSLASVDEHFVHGEPSA